VRERVELNLGSCGVWPRKRFGLDPSILEMGDRHARHQFLAINLSAGRGNLVLEIDAARKNGL
jgi:hypothetical protein